ncbi:hypothetical protein H4219_004291 [Mycoemilia scoparia]|uniref:Uncharacterized protein n=1 Tax=Mycoemilia scoparia TaxID=417184 RepID=A0A9W8DS41_9FUNG|nr:hypothetical protein H4219_004291 [Mycoemilia scoparia]
MKSVLVPIITVALASLSGPFIGLATAQGPPPTQPQAPKSDQAQPNSQTIIITQQQGPAGGNVPNYVSTAPSYNTLLPSKGYGITPTPEPSSCPPQETIVQVQPVVVPTTVYKSDVSTKTVTTTSCITEYITNRPMRPKYITITVVDYEVETMTVTTTASKATPSSSMSSKPSGGSSNSGSGSVSSKASASPSEGGGSSASGSSSRSSSSSSSGSGSSPNEEY